MFRGLPCLLSTCRKTTLKSRRHSQGQQHNEVVWCNASKNSYFLFTWRAIYNREHHSKVGWACKRNSKGYFSFGWLVQMSTPAFQQNQRPPASPKGCTKIALGNASSKWDQTNLFQHLLFCLLMAESPSLLVSSILSLNFLHSICHFSFSLKKMSYFLVHLCVASTQTIC